MSDTHLVHPEGSASRTKISAWIEKFNKEKGWDTIVTPSPDGTKLMKTPVHRYEAQRDKAIKETDDARKKMEAAKKNLDDLEKETSELRLKKKLDEADEEKLNNVNKKLVKLEELAAATKADHRAKQRYVDEQDRVITQIEAIEKNLDQQLDDVGREIDVLEARLEKKGNEPLKPVDKTELAGFMQWHDDVAAEIETERDRTFTMQRIVGDKTIEYTYSNISNVEYELLYGMLEQAILLSQIGDMKEALTRIVQTRKKLQGFYNARLGKRTGDVEEIDSYDIRLSRPLDEAGRKIETVRTMGFVKEAKTLEDKRSQLEQNIRKMHKSKPDKVSEHFTKDVETFARLCGEKEVLANVFVEILAHVRMKIEGLRELHKGTPVIGDEKTLAEGYDQKLEKLDLGKGITTAIDVAKTILSDIEKDIAVGRDEAIADRKVTIAELEKKLEARRTAYNEMCKQASPGVLKTKKNSKTGEREDVIIDRKIPPEALAEIKMQIDTAEMHLASNSPEAIRRAHKYLRSVEKFETAVIEHSDQFEEIEDDIAETNKIIDRMRLKYSPYEVGAREELKVELDKLEGDYRAKNPTESRGRSKTLLKQAMDLKETVKKQYEEYKEFEKEAKKATELIDQLGHILKKTSSRHGLDGYYGKWAGDLRSAQYRADEHTKDSLKAALKTVRAVNTALTKRVNKLGDIVSRSDKGETLTDEDQDYKDRKEASAWDSYDTQNEVNGAREKYDEKLKAIRKAVKGVAHKFEKQKLDPTEVEAAKQEILSIRDEITNSEKYDKLTIQVKKLTEKTERLLELSAEVTKLASQADALKPGKNSKVDKEAKKIVDNMKAFAEFAGGLIKKIEEAGDISTLKLTKKDVNDFLHTVVSAVRDDELKKLGDNAKVVADPTTPDSKARKAREAALSAVRAMKATLDTYGPVKHFRSQEFASDATLGKASKALPRLEIQLLTALGKK